MEKNDLFERYESFLYYLMKKTEYEKDKNLNEDKYRIKLLTLRIYIMKLKMLKKVFVKIATMKI